MIYPYYCNKCGHDFDIIKRIFQIDDIETCDQCHSIAERRIAKANLVAIHDWTEQYNPAFGKVVRNKAHQREILKEFKDQGKEFIEIGNESLENIHKRFDTMREDKQKANWNEPTEKIMQEVLN